MKILIAGGAGYIGSALIPKLLDQSHEVSVVDLLWFGRNLPQSIPIQQIDILALSKDDLAGYDQVLFLAGISNDPMADYSPSQNFVHNAAAPAYLAYLAKLAGVRRFIYAGSCSVYGFTDNLLYDESSPAISSFPYGISKLQGEKAVLQLADDDFSVIAFRQGTVNGYSPRMRLDLVVNTMFMFAMRTGRLTVNNPDIWRPILSMDDATEAYIRAIGAEDEISGIFNVSSGNYSVGEIGATVAAVFKKQLGRDISIETQHVSDVRNYKVSTAKAAEILGFTAQHPLTSIVENLIATRDNFSDFDNQIYYNIQVFKALLG